MFFRRIPQKERHNFVCEHVGCLSLPVYIRKNYAYCEKHRPAKAPEVAQGIDEPSYTVQLMTPHLGSLVHVAAPDEISARLSIADDIARGFWLGHECPPIVFSCRRNGRAA